MLALVVFAGEVKHLRCELEAERSLVRQEREDTAQQLLRTRQQYDSALSLQKTNHQAAINMLLQDLVGNNVLLNSSSKLCGLALEEEQPERVK